jgi:hypothetical protein
MWIGKGSSQGLDILDLNKPYEKNAVLSHFTNNPDNPASLIDNSVYTIFEDIWGDIWIGTYGKGISYYNRRVKKFENFRQNIHDKNSIGNNQVNAIFEDNENLWIGTENGLNRVNKKTGGYFEYYNNPVQPSSLSGKAVYAIYKDSFNNLWIGTWNGGLNLYHPEKNNFTYYLHNPGNKKSINNNNIFSIFQDSKGNLWIGTIGGGPNLFDYRTKTFKHYMDITSVKKGINIKDVNVILETKKKNLFISTYSNLLLYNFDIDDFEIKNLNSTNDPDFIEANIKVLFEDSRGKLWIGTEGGLICMDQDTWKTIQYTIRHGLPNNSIKGILEDNSGNLWISTTVGLTKFISGTTIPENPEFKNYNSKDGLPGNEFIKRSAFKNKSGHMYFGAQTDIHGFIPTALKIMP